MPSEAESTVTSKAKPARAEPSAHSRGRIQPRARSLALYSAAMAELRKTVLVVDSDEASREALSGALRRDYRVLRTATGESAIQMARARGRGRDAARRHAARHQRHRRPEDRQGELPAHRRRRHVAGRGAGRRHRGDAPRRLPLHGEERGRRRRPHAGGQRLRAAGPEPQLPAPQRRARRAGRPRVRGRRQPRHPRDRRPGAAHRQASRHGARPRRERHRQGAAGAPPSPPGRRSGRAVRRREPRRDSRGPDREHAVRPREGVVHRRHQAADRQVRAGVGRHAVPRRGRRPAHGAAGEAAARDPGERDRARRRHAIRSRPTSA